MENNWKMIAFTISVICKNAFGSLIIEIRASAKAFLFRKRKKKLYY